jgi:hypothetical protein
MKRSAQVVAPLLASAALALLTGCRKPEMQRCVDENNHVVADSLCNGQPQQRSDGHGGFIFVPSPYRFYYGGWGGFDLGSTVGGGVYSPASGVSYSTGTTRGGFGSTLSGSDGAGE